MSVDIILAADQRVQALKLDCETTQHCMFVLKEMLYHADIISMDVLNAAQSEDQW